MWQAMCLYASRGEDHYDAYNMAEQLTHQAEIRNCAPWQDTQKPAIELDGIDVHPVRKKITADDVQPGAVFVDAGEFGKARTVVFVNDGLATIQREDADAGDTYGIEIWEFVLNRNNFNATVTQPILPE